MPKTVLPKNVMYAHIGLVIVTLIWGAATPIIKYTLDYIPPFTFLFLRFLIVCLVLMPAMITMLSNHKVDKRDYFNFFLLGVFSQTSLAFTFLGLEYTTALDVTIISVLGSILAVAAGHYFYKEKVDNRIKWGLIIATIGTIVVVLEPILLSLSQHIPPHKRLLGNFLTLLSSLTWLIYVIWSKMSMGESSSKLKKTLSFIHIKPMKQRYSPQLLSGISFYVGLITILPLMVLEVTGVLGTHEIYNFSIALIDSKGVLGLLYMAIFSSIVAYMLMQWALEYVQVSDTAFYSYLGTIFTLPLAYLILGEIPNTYMIIGGILIAIGVVIAEFKFDLVKLKQSWYTAKRNEKRYTPKSK